MYTSILPLIYYYYYYYCHMVKQLHSNDRSYVGQILDIQCKTSDLICNIVIIHVVINIIVVP